MVSQQDNDLLTRTGPGTPMGELIRRYWVPVGFSNQLPRPDAPPIRVKLLGEKLVAFRDSTGHVGLVDERCPHRGASLFFGRNEEAGLRCVYHGWKFDRDGRCVDMPSEPAESSFKKKVRVTAYPCIERGGVVWTYMGPAELMPAFPDIEWTAVPESHRMATRHLQECNWFQGLEGGFDASHLSFLHKGDTGSPGGNVPLATEYEPVPSDFGMIMASGRKQASGGVQWSLDLLLMPFHKLINRHGKPDSPIGAHMWVPVDDERCMIYSIEYHPDRPLGDEEMRRSTTFNYIHAENLPGSDHCVINGGNDYLIDRDVQASRKSFTGIKGIGMQDCGIQESMGRIADRARETLGRSDRLVIHLRRLMFQVLEGMKNGAPPPGLEPAAHNVRSAVVVLPPDVHLEKALAEQIRIAPASEVAA
jgi:phthalate 4,5-dioxygenase